MALRVQVDRRVLAGFRRRALRAYPREYMETIWGRNAIDGIQVRTFQPIPHKATKKELEYEEAEIPESAEDAEDHRMELLGTIHTHPDSTDASPSELDWDDASERGELIFGICNIRKQANGRRRTRIRFWPTAHHLPIKVI